MRWKSVLSHIGCALLGALVTFTVLFVFLDFRPETKLGRLERIIEKRYIGIEDVDMQQVEDAAANAMVNALGDRWSYYLNEAAYENNISTQNNTYVGIGVSIFTELQDGCIVVEQVTPGGPAEEAGILAGDRIRDVAGESVESMGLSEAQSRIRGKAGTSIELTVLRDGQELTLSVERKEIETQIVTKELLDGNVGYVRIVNFRGRSSAEAQAAVEDLMAQGATSLIFDVRFNPGGFVKEVADLLDYLMPEGVVFRSVDYTGKEEIYDSDADCIDLPMVVLVNGDSYSAAEHFAATLKEAGLATVVGQKTVGKGRFQVVYSLLDGSGVGLSIGKYFTPGGEYAGRRGPGAGRDRGGGRGYLRRHPCFHPLPCRRPPGPGCFGGFEGVTQKSRGEFLHGFFRYSRIVQSARGSSACSWVATISVRSLRSSPRACAMKRIFSASSEAVGSSRSITSKLADQKIARHTRRYSPRDSSPSDRRITWSSPSGYRRTVCSTEKARRISQIVPSVISGSASRKFSRKVSRSMWGSWGK